MQTREVLEQLVEGKISIEEAEKFFKKEPIENMGFARLDLHREVRSGFPEVIFCQNKPDEFLIEIFKKLVEKDKRALGTRASEHQAELILSELPNAQYDKVSRILKVDPMDRELKGNVCVCSAGTADLFVAEEAAQTAEYFGAGVTRVYDVGVSGLHRLLAEVDTIRKATCVIAVAGMEGALASVIGGLVENPVIAVPTSVGYGANMKGLSALLTMINSCANGIAVVNIDNGYGAGYMAAQINRLAVRGYE
ncbi:nickel pincer cofactor biosynthesis protein LarB [Butyrivibrio sp. MC2013]|uniref:nickel pincer cofactor biosynthesis protein LarB n=1 Tax=Butyrivibrio sp. MC2013 TaxID=1280686 RepID=UPI00042A3C85|nr:nickel pincer cofactor biosynthesis protein LarB [Butyrivibrio sp. MC2013]